MKIQICFCLEKNFRFIFNENTNLFFFFLIFRKILRSVFNENTEQFFYSEKNFRSIFNENTNLFCLEKFSNMYLIKIQIC